MNTPEEHGDRPFPVVVVGASAGGIAPLGELLAAVPQGFRGAVCIVLHLSPEHVSHLAAILDRASTLPVGPAVDGERLRAGQVVVAVPDRHLLVVDHEVRLGHGPAENGHRPAVDVLFRSAAEQLGPDAVAVVLSGALDDGVAGACEVKVRGGLVAVQDPDEADHPSMPRSALRALHADLVAPAAAIGAWLGRFDARLPSSPVPPGRSAIDAHRDAGVEIDLEEKGADRSNGADDPPDFPGLTCPDCHRALHEAPDGDLLRFACLIGHRWSPASLASAHDADVETALWAEVRELEERAAFLRRLAKRARGGQRGRAAVSFAAAADQASRHATALRAVVDEASVEGAPDTLTAAGPDADAVADERAESG